MFPGVNGFHWTFGHILFVSAFATVLLVIAATVLAAFLRSRRDVWQAKTDAIRWHADWEDLAERDRRCRHDIAGQVMYRVCPNGFDCRGCRDHAHFAPPPIGDTAGEHYGLTFPANRYYHRGHTWVEPQDDGTLLIGLDEIGARLVRPPDTVALPELGTRLTLNGPGWRIAREGVDVRVLAPVDGEVVDTGGALAGWYLRVRPTQWPPDLRHLLRGGEVRPWVGRELTRLQMLLAPTLADGGVLMPDALARQPAAECDRVLGAMLLDP
jgi:hypothetical protein